MKLCRFNHNRLGILEDQQVFDVSAALAEIPAREWPAPHGDPLVRHLQQVVKAATVLRPAAKAYAMDAGQHSQTHYIAQQGDGRAG